MRRSNAQPISTSASHAFFGSSRRVPFELDLRRRVYDNQPVCWYAPMSTEPAAGSGVPT